MQERFDILVIDDEPVVIGAACKILEAEGYSVDQATEANAARRKVSCNTYGLVLCDLMLPETSGLEMLAYVEHDQSNTPLVMITGYATLANAVDAFKLGVFDFIPKPFDVAELVGVVQRGLHFARSTHAKQARTALDALAHSTDSKVSGDARLFTLGQHSWVALERDGSARIGMGETFADLATEPVDAEFPGIGEDTLQGNRCVRISGGQNAVHRVWAPLSGRVIATNQDAFGDADRAGWSTLCRRWLIQIQSSNLEDELPNLIRCKERT